MKKFGFLLFLVSLVLITLSSSTCRKPPPGGGDIVPNDSDTVAQDPDISGPLNVSVRLYTVAGTFAGGAKVMVARSFDSATKEKYFLNGITDSNGYVTFKNLPAPANGTKAYYLNASITYGGDDLHSMNPKGNGPVGVNLTKGGTKSAALVVTEP